MPTLELSGQCRNDCQFTVTHRSDPLERIVSPAGYFGTNETRNWVKNMPKMVKENKATTRKANR